MLKVFYYENNFIACDILLLTKIRIMKNLRYLFLAFCMMGYSGILNEVNAQSSWITRTLDDGKITVRYKFTEKIDEEGKEMVLIEDMTTTVAELEYEKCIAFMKDIERHKEFTGDYISKNVKKVSDTEWIVYYYSRNPWPVANTDCVARMVLTEDKESKRAVFQLSAAPDQYEMGEVARMTIYNVSFTFWDKGEGQVEIIEKGRTSPAVKVPQWLIKSAFPKVPADAMRNLVRLIGEY